MNKNLDSTPDQNDSEKKAEALPNIMFSTDERGGYEHLTPLVPLPLVA